MEPETIDPISITTFMDGAAVEQFNMELRKAIDNALDINTKPTATRKVTLEFFIKPDDDMRQTASLAFGVKSTLAPQTPMATRGYLLKKNGKAVAYEHNPKQIPMFNSDQAKPALVEPPKAANDL